MLEAFDLGVKVEMFAQKFMDVIVLLSSAELTLFVLLFLFFLRLPADMSYVFLHLPHLFRGIIGLVIAKRIPKTHEII